MKYFLILIIAMSCSKANQGEKAGELTKKEQIKRKYEQKLAEAKEKFDQKTGWPDAKDCDGLLWAGIAKASGVDTVKLELAKDSDGTMHRRPLSSGECYSAESKTTISRDMLLGLTFGAWRSRNGDLIKGLAQYGESNAWIMGRPSSAVGEVLLTGNMIGVLGRAACELSKYCPEYRRIPPLHSKSDVDYIQHLTVLYILLNGEIDNPLGYTKPIGLSIDKTRVGDVSKDEVDVLKWHADKSPSDMLFQTAMHLYTDGNFNEMVDDLLTDNSYVPPYVRGSDNYPIVHWLFVTKLIMQRYP